MGTQAEGTATAATAGVTETDTNDATTGTGSGGTGAGRRRAPGLLQAVPRSACDLPPVAHAVHLQQVQSGDRGGDGGAVAPAATMPTHWLLTERLGGSDAGQATYKPRTRPLFRRLLEEGDKEHVMHPGVPDNAFLLHAVSRTGPGRGVMASLFR